MEDRVLPTYDEVIALPMGSDIVIPSEYVDMNGHLNVRHYLGIFDDCGWPYLNRFNLSPERVARDRRGIMDLENHTRYHAEVLEGERVSVHGRLIGRASKALHWMEFLVNRTTGRLAATLEMVTVFVDLEARRATVWDDDIAACLDAQLAMDETLTWAVPTSGCLSLRR